MSKFRCDEILVQIVATELDDMDRPIGRLVGAQAPVFRASARDFWAEVDKAVHLMAKQQRDQAKPPAEAKPVPKGKKR